MKVVGVEFGRCSYLLDLLDLGARTGVYLPEAAIAVQTRYGFVHAPPLPQPSQQQQMYRFEIGKFTHVDHLYSIAAFEVHPHGLVVQATDTNGAEAFLDDFIKFGIAQLGLKAPTRPPVKVYTSAIVIEFAKPFNNIVKKFEAVSSLLSTHLAETYGIKSPAQVSTLAFKPDPQDLTPRMSALLGDFVIERRVHEPFEHQRFYTLAPLRTDDHISLLVKLEKFLQ